MKQCFNRLPRAKLSCCQIGLQSEHNVLLTTKLTRMLHEILHLGCKSTPSLYVKVSDIFQEKLECFIDIISYR